METDNETFAYIFFIIYAWTGLFPKLSDKKKYTKFIIVEEGEMVSYITAGQKLVSAHFARLVWLTPCFIGETEALIEGLVFWEYEKYYVSVACLTDSSNYKMNFDPT